MIPYMLITAHVQGFTYCLFVAEERRTLRIWRISHIKNVIWSYWVLNSANEKIVAEETTQLKNQVPPEKETVLTTVDHYPQNNSGPLSYTFGQ